jgi:hypothetical protein
MTDHPPATRRLRGDDGVALVEAAIISPIFFIMLLGAMEFGLLYRDYLSVSDAAAEGAKIGSIQSKYNVAPAGGTNANLTADYSIVSAIRQDLSAFPYYNIDRIVIFRSLPPAAGAALSVVPTACRTGPFGANTAAHCNVYDTYNAFLAVQNGTPADIKYFDCSVNASSPSCGYPPNTRTDGPTWNQIDYIGVYIRATHKSISGMFPSKTLESASVIRLEPGQLQ